MSLNNNIIIINLRAIDFFLIALTVETFDKIVEYPEQYCASSTRI